jgi:hypothetical protein
VALQRERDRLQYEAPIGGLADADLATMRRYKYDLLALLASDDPRVRRRVAAMRERHPLRPGKPLPTLTARDTVPGTRGCVSCGEPRQPRDGGPEYRCEPCQYAARLVLMGWEG